MGWNIIAECFREDGKQSTITLGTITRLAGSTLRKTSESFKRYWTRSRHPRTREPRTRISRHTLWTSMVRCDSERNRASLAR